MKVEWIGNQKVIPRFGLLSKGDQLEVSEAEAKTWCDAKLCKLVKDKPKLKKEDS